MQLPLLSNFRVGLFHFSISISFLYFSFTKIKRMRKIYSVLCLSFFTFFFSDLAAQCNNGRYYDKIFSQSTSTVTFGNAMQFDSAYVDLKMDIYQPTCDNLVREFIWCAFPICGTR